MTVKLPSEDRSPSPSHLFYPNLRPLPPPQTQRRRRLHLAAHVPRADHLAEARRVRY